MKVFANAGSRAGSGRRHPCMGTRILDLQQQRFAFPDTVSDVIHDAAQRPSGRQRSGIVDNSAARKTANVDKLSVTSRSTPSPSSIRILAPQDVRKLVP